MEIEDSEASQEIDDEDSDASDIRRIKAQQEVEDEEELEEEDEDEEEVEEEQDSDEILSSVDAEEKPKKLSGKQRDFARL